MGFLAICGVVVTGPWQEPTKTLLDKKQLANAEGCSVRTVERDLEAGAPFTRTRFGHVRFDYSEYLAWKRKVAS